MGLAAYGKPKFLKEIYQIIDIKDDGSFQLDLNYFSFRENFSMFNEKFVKIFGSPRKPNEKITKRHADIGSSIQKVTEEIYFKMLNHLYSLTKTKNLCISGGVALNALANGQIYQKTPFKNVYIFGAAGDSGAAIGAALFAYFLIKEKVDKKSFQITNLYLGSDYNNDQIEKTIKEYRLKFYKFKNKNELIEKTAKLLSEGNIIGWFQGKMEFGPRALGSRSILARPWPKNMKKKVNEIKRREQFRPFAASVLQEKVDEYFDVPEKNHWSPFMTFCFKVKKDKLKIIPAIVHADETCRIQTVNKTNCIYYELIKKFYQLTGIACILNTSFNLKGEPIVENPRQAIEDFLKTKMNYLVIEDFLLFKN